MVLSKNKNSGPGLFLNLLSFYSRKSACSFFLLQGKNENSDFSSNLLVPIFVFLSIKVRVFVFLVWGKNENTELGLILKLLSSNLSSYLRKSKYSFFGMGQKRKLKSSDMVSKVAFQTRSVWNWYEIGTDRGPGRKRTKHFTKLRSTDVQRCCMLFGHVQPVSGQTR